MKGKRKLAFGFTIIELIIIMAIIGGMAALVVVNFPASQKRARDTKRKSDLKQYQTAIEISSNNKDGYFPSRTAPFQADLDAFCVNDLGFNSGECPSDPRDGRAVCGDGDDICRYFYISDGTGGGNFDASKYVLWAAIEQPTKDEVWVVCSNGSVGEEDIGTFPLSSADCPL